MLKGFAITPVITGRIGIGEIVEQGGKRLPHKLDHIVITGMTQVSDGSWREHPEMLNLIAKQKSDGIDHPEKLRSIPIRIMFDRPESNFKAEYTCFDQKARPVCSGDGEKAKRRTADGMSNIDCPGSDMCEFGQKNRCKQFGRLIVGMESSFKNDPLTGFIFRTTSFNSIRALTARLKYLAAATGGKMSGMPCNLRMRSKSTAASFRTPIFYLDLEPAGGLVAASKEAMAYRAEFTAAGLDRDALEAAVTEGLAESSFYEVGDDIPEVVEEFFTFNDEQEKDDGAAKQAAATESQRALDQALGQATEATLCSPEQVDKIKTLLAESGQDILSLLAFLQRKPDTTLEQLTSVEAARAIIVLSPNLKSASIPASEPAKATIDEAAAASKGQDTVATAAKPQPEADTETDSKPLGLCSPEQSERIKSLLVETGGNLPALLEFLKRKSDTTIAEFTSLEAGRAITFLTPEIKASPATAEAKKPARTRPPKKNTASIPAGDIDPLKNSKGLPIMQMGTNTKIQEFDQFL